MSRYFILLTAITLLWGCGGATRSEAAPGSSGAAADASNVCGQLADSGLTFAQCIAASCCSELTTCVHETDGIPYETCVQNCTFDGSVDAADGKTCSDTCGAAHPQGASACRPYLDCAVQSCPAREK